MWFQHRGQTLGVNLNLVLSERLTFEELCQVVQLHKERYDLKTLLEATEDPTLMKIIYNQLTELEFELQHLWGFPLSAIHHRSFLWPKCKCPRMDNLDAFPLLQYYNTECPLHGEYINEKVKKQTNAKSI